MTKSLLEKKQNKTETKVLSSGLHSCLLSTSRSNRPFKKGAVFITFLWFCRAFILIFLELWINSRFNRSLICWRSRLGEVRIIHMYIAASRCKSCVKKIRRKSSNQCLFRSWRARWGGAIFSGPRTTSSGKKKVGTICSRLLNEQ